MFSNRQLSYVFDRPIVGMTMEIRKLNMFETDCLRTFRRS